MTPAPQTSTPGLPALAALAAAGCCLSMSAKAQIASTKIQAVAAYVSGNCESVIPLNDFFTKILGMTDEEAAPLVKSAEEQQALMEQQQAEQEQFGDQYGGEQQDQEQFGQEESQSQFDQQPDQGTVPEQFQPGDDDEEE